MATIQRTRVVDNAAVAVHDGTAPGYRHAVSTLLAIESVEQLRDVAEHWGVSLRLFFREHPSIATLVLLLLIYLAFKVTRWALSTRYI